MPLQECNLGRCSMAMHLRVAGCAALSMSFSEVWSRAGLLLKFHPSPSMLLSSIPSAMSRSGATHHGVHTHTNAHTSTNSISTMATSRKCLLIIPAKGLRSNLALLHVNPTSTTTTSAEHATSYLEIPGSRGWYYTALLPHSQGISSCEGVSRGSILLSSLPGQCARSLSLPPLGASFDSAYPRCSR